MEVTTESLLRITSDCFTYCNEKTRHMINDGGLKMRQLQGSMIGKSEKRADAERDKCVDACEMMHKRCPDPDKLALFHREQEEFEQKAASRPAATSTTGGIKTDSAGGWRGQSFFGGGDGKKRKGEEKPSGLTWTAVDRCEVLAEELVKIIYTLATKPVKVEITMPEGKHALGGDGGLQNSMIGSGKMGMSTDVEKYVDPSLSLDEQMAKLREVEIAHEQSGGEGGPLFHGMMSPKGHESAKRFAQMGEGTFDASAGTISMVPRGDSKFTQDFLEKGTAAVQGGVLPTMEEFNAMGKGGGGGGGAGGKKGVVNPSSGSVPFGYSGSAPEEPGTIVDPRASKELQELQKKKITENPHYHPAVKSHLLAEAEKDAQQLHQNMKQPSEELSSGVRTALYGQQLHESSSSSSNAAKAQQVAQQQQQQQAMSKNKKPKVTKAEVDEVMEELRLPNEQRADAEMRANIERQIQEQREQVSMNDFAKVNDLIAYSQKHGMFSDDPNRKMLNEMKVKLDEHMHLLTPEKAKQMEEMKKTDPERFRLWKEQMDMEVKLSTMGVQRSGMNW